MNFPKLFTLTIEGLDAPNLANVQRADFTYNPFGFIPGVTWLPKVVSDGGNITVPELDPDAPPLAINLKKTVNKVAITNYNVQLDAARPETKMTITEAIGSVHTGSVKVKAEGNGAQITVNGSKDASDNFALGGELVMTGDSVKDVAALAGFVGPDTPPFSIRTNYLVTRESAELDILDGTIGDSDIAGTLNISLTDPVPMIIADLRSEKLDLDDLGIVFGLPTGTAEGETASAEQKAAKAAFDASDRFIPNAEIDLTRLDAVDAQISYKAGSVQAGALAIQTLEYNVTIDGRVVTAKDVRATFPQGDILAYVTLDASQTPASTDVKGEVTNLSMAGLNADAFAKGSLEGEFNFNTRGNNFRAAAASATGNISIWSKDMELVEIGSELAGLDLGESLLLLLEDESETDFIPVRCAAISLRADNGQLDFSPAVIDTEDSVIALVGGINLADETMKIDVETDAKDASFGTLLGNVSLGGTLKNPDINIIDEETILQVGIATVLGVFAGPLAALPFIEPGDGDDVPCGSLLARAQVAADTQAETTVPKVVDP